MIVFVCKRVLAAVLISFGVSAIVFFGGRALAPGTVATVIAGSNGATPAEMRELEHRLGLDRPLIDQYGSWLAGVVRGDFGTSPISHEPVIDIVAREAPVSMELALMALVLGTVIGIPVGAVAARYSNTLADLAIRLPLLATLAIPVFVVGLAFVVLASRFAPTLYSAQYVPLSESIGGNLTSMALPTITAALPVAAMLAQMTREAVLTSMRQPHTTMLVAKGLAPWRVVYLHSLKNALGPILTLEGFLFGILLGSLFVVEDIFNLPGLGRGTLSSIGDRDFTAVQTQVLVVALAFVIGNLLVDLLHPVVDRRISTR